MADAKQLSVPKPTKERLNMRSADYVRPEIVDAVRADWTAEEYHSKHAGGTVSRSELATHAKNPNDYRAQVLLGQRGDISDAMRVGQCLHMELLEGHEKPAYVPLQGVLTSDGKRMGNAWKQWLEKNGKYYVLPKERDALGFMADAARKNPAVSEFLTPGGRFNTRHESTILAKHEPTGIRTRCRYDIESVFLFDIKKTHDVSQQAFAAHCADLGYHCQGAFYQDHCAALHGERDARPFILIAIQDSGDYRCEVYQMDEEFIQIGRKLNHIRLDNFAMYQAAWEIMEALAAKRGAKPNPEDIWTPASEGRIQFLKPPAKAMYQVEWEADAETVHRVLSERVQKAAKTLKIEGQGEIL